MRTLREWGVGVVTHTGGAAALRAAVRLVYGGGRSAFGTMARTELACYRAHLDGVVAIDNREELLYSWAVGCARGGNR